MPALDSYSILTAEDLMDSSELSVSPILVSSIFDEIYTSPETLNVSENTTDTRYENVQRHQHNQISTSPNRIETTLPNTRWRRRLPRVIHREETESNSDDEDYNTGPIAPINYRFPRISGAADFIYGQNCLNDVAVNTSLMCTGVNTMLDFDVIFDDGGQYGAMYGIENILLNDGSVYCSGRKGTVNILSQYCGFIESRLIPDTSCSISKIVIKAPLYGFTAPCKDGLIFISHKEIDISETHIFDNFTKDQYDAYVQEKIQSNGILDDSDPVAWFTLKQDKLAIIDLVDRAGKYVLIKLLRADHESDNIDIQYIGFIGYAGSRSFGCSKLF